MGSGNQYGNSAIRDRNRRSMNRGTRSRAYSGSNDGGFWSELPRTTKGGIIAFVLVVGIVGISVGASGGNDASSTQANQVAQNSGQPGNETVTEIPTLSPTEATAAPTLMPTGEPIAIGAVTDTPTVSTGGWKPNQPTTGKPTTAPTGAPTILPTPLLSREPTSSPSESPTLSPTEWPTYSPTEWPTYSPTEWPTYSPTGSPTESPNVTPTTATPTSTPTSAPSTSPTGAPTSSPTFAAEMVISNIQTPDGTNVPPPQVPVVQAATGYRLGNNEYKVFEFSTPEMDLQLTRAWLWLIGSSVSQDIEAVMFTADKNTSGNVTMFANVTNRIVFGNETPRFPDETETTNFNYQFVPTFVNGTSDHLMANMTYYLSVDAGVPGALWQVNCYNDTNCAEPDQSIPEGKLKLEALYKNTPEEPTMFYPDATVNAFAIEARYV